MKKNRQSYRLKNYDYTRKGLYFVTICTEKRAHYFGQIQNKQMELSEIGQIASESFENIPNFYPHIEVVTQVVMPNHVHGLLWFKEGEDRDIQVSTFQHVIPKSLSVVINQYKGAVTKYANQHEIAFIWQARFHDSIVWEESEAETIIRYIEQNPENWENDDFYGEK